MNERSMAKISATGSVFCIILIYLLTLSVSSLHVKIGELDKSYTGKIVNVTGQVRGVFRNGGHVFFTLQDETGSVKVVLWEDTLDALKIKGVDIESIKDGAHINIVGSVQIYRGELEVIPVHGNVKIS